MTYRVTLPPERESIEKEVAEMFSNGDFTDIARLLHRDRSAVSRAFSIDDQTRHNPVFEIVSYLWAFDQLRDLLGDEIVALILRERAKWTPRLAVPNCPVSLTTNIGTQFNEFLESKLKGEPWDMQIKECEDIETAARKKKDWLIVQRSNAKSGDVRSFGAAAVDRRIA